MIRRFERPGLLALVLLAGGASAAERPRVGVVLSGSGELAVANVGALKGLAELHVPIDVIVGTGLGAVIGGSYAGGTPVAGMERLFTEADWSDFLADAPVSDYFADQPRSLLLSSSTFSVSGRNLDLLLQGLIARAPAASSYSFDRLLIPFCSVSTDLSTGEPVVFSSGNLPAALRPNMVSMNPASVITWRGREIGDVPGLTRSVAIGAARAMGADVVVLVDLPAPLVPPGAAAPELRLAYRVLDLLTRDADRRPLREANIVLRPDPVDLTTPTRGIEEVINLGVQSVHSSARSLEPLRVSQAEYRAWAARFPKP